jgi:hypothetical protein
LVGVRADGEGRAGVRHDKWSAIFRVTFQLAEKSLVGQDVPHEKWFWRPDIVSIQPANESSSPDSFPAILFAIPDLPDSRFILSSPPSRMLEKKRK